MCFYTVYQNLPAHLFEENSDENSHQNKCNTLFQNKVWANLGNFFLVIVKLYQRKLINNIIEFMFNVKGASIKKVVYSGTKRFIGILVPNAIGYKV